MADGESESVRGAKGGFGYKLISASLNRVRPIRCYLRSARVIGALHRQVRNSCRTASRSPESHSVASVDVEVVDVGCVGRGCVLVRRWCSPNTANGAQAGAAIHITAQSLAQFSKHSANNLANHLVNNVYDRSKREYHSANALDSQLGRCCWKLLETTMRSRASLAFPHGSGLLI